MGLALLDGLFSSKPVEFADRMVEKIERQFPPASEAQLVKKGAQRRLEGVLQHIMNDLDAFQKEAHLGWIAKARLGNAFRWKLTDRGYSKQFAEGLTEGIIKRIATAK
jgi:hypothetical protein